jgi:hypothetical protein
MIPLRGTGPLSRRRSLAGRAGAHPCSTPYSVEQAEPDPRPGAAAAKKLVCHFHKLELPATTGGFNVAWGCLIAQFEVRSGMVPQPLLLLPRTVRILVVEDEVLIRALIAEELRLEGFSVIEADRADDALTYIKAGAQVDLVFSDIQTPGSLNGLQLAVPWEGIS